MKNKKVGVVYLGYSGFPIGYAEVQKIKLLSKSLVNEGAEVIVINRRGSLPPGREGVEVQGTWDGVPYLYTSGTPYRHANFFVRSWHRLKGVTGELMLLLKLKRKRSLDYAIISSKRIGLLLWYKILARILGFRTVLNYAEHIKAIKKERTAKLDLNAILYDKFAFGLVDGVIPISDFLEEQVRQRFPHKPMLKIPVLCDYSEFERLPVNAHNQVEHSAEDRFFLFCSVFNKELIFFIIESFASLNNQKGYQLYLVVNGGPVQLRRLDDYIKSLPYGDMIKVFSKLPYQQLVDYYLQAKALLIPMRPVVRDIARFPHKIGEYTASGNPIISTNFGEIKNYFQDQLNGLIADNYEVSDFASKMQFVIDQPLVSANIGDEGKKVGLEHFDYLLYGSRMLSFFKSLP